MHYKLHQFGTKLKYVYNQTDKHFLNFFFILPGIYGNYFIFPLRNVRLPIQEAPEEEVLGIYRIILIQCIRSLTFYLVL